LENLSALNPEILVTKISIGCREIAFCPVAHIILSHPLYYCVISDDLVKTYSSVIFR